MSKPQIYALIAAAFAIAGWWIVALVFLFFALLLPILGWWSRLPKPPRHDTW